MTVRPAKTLIRLGGSKTQISLGIRPVWSESSLSARAWVLSYPMSAQRRLWSGWSESSLGAQSLCWFCHEAAHIVSHWYNELGHSKTYSNDVYPANAHNSLCSLIGLRCGLYKEYYKMRIGVLKGRIGVVKWSLECNLKTKITPCIDFTLISVHWSKRLLCRLKTNNEGFNFRGLLQFSIRYPGPKGRGRWSSYPCHNFDLNIASTHMRDGFVSGSKVG